jgi:Nuclease-related domain
VSASDSVIRLRYDATCCVCAVHLRSGSTAAWNKATREATCAPCLGIADVDRGTAGASARREFLRRHDRRDAQIRESHKLVGGLLSALSSDPASTRSWGIGAKGEETIGPSLDALRSEGLAVLHDRQMPASTANIDHIVVSQAGVFVIDTKHYQGQVARRGTRLFVGSRERSHLLEGILRQRAVVRRTLAERDMYREIPVTAALLFMSTSNWPLFQMRPLQFDGVYVLWGKALGKLVRSSGSVPPELIPRLERFLAATLPSSKSA